MRPEQAIVVVQPGRRELALLLHCDSFAADGYEVLAPSLYDRLEPEYEAEYDEPDSIAKGVRYSQETPWDQVAADLQVDVRVGLAVPVLHLRHANTVATTEEVPVSQGAGIGPRIKQASADRGAAGGSESRRFCRRRRALSRRRLVRRDSGQHYGSNAR